MSGRKQYTDAQKAAYYKKKAAAGGTTRTYAKKAPATKSRAYSRYKATKTYSRAAPSKGPGMISEGGKFLGDLVHPVAGFLGGKLGHLVEQITGFGDYKIEQNSIMKGGMLPAQIVNSTTKGGTIIRHREYIGDIVATTAFTLQSFVVNPGIFTTFPWLSQIANSYDQYKMRGMIFEYTSTSSDALLSSATSTALGTVVMSTDYDVADLAPANKRQMMNSQWASSSKPSCSFIHPIECKQSLTPQSMLYTRGTNVPSGYDARLYDLCRFNIATEGMQASGGVLGELWVTYEVELYKQQLAFIGATDHYKFTAATSTSLLGTVVNGGSVNIGGVINGAGTAYSFSPTLGNGKYFVSYFVQGTVAAATTYAPVVLTNCTYLNYWSGGFGQISPLNNSNTVSMICFLVQVNSQGAAFTFPTMVIPTGTTVGDLWVTRISDSVTA